MFGWMTKKLQAGRIAMSIAQLEHELAALSPGEIASARLGAKFADNFRNDMKLMEIGLRLLLSRIAVSIDRDNKPKLRGIARRVDVGVPLIGEAIKRLRLQHSAIGTPKPEDHYAGVDASARLYAFSYMASFYGATQP